VHPRFLIATILGRLRRAGGMPLPTVWGSRLSQRMYMWRWLKALVDWVFSRRSSLTLLSLQAPNAGEASRGGRRRPDPPQGPSDPDSRVRAPRWHGPKGRSASIAVAEPDDDESVVAIGGHDSGGLGANGDLAAKPNRRWTCRSPLSGAWFHSTELATPAASHDRTLAGGLRRSSPTVGNDQRRTVYEP
jgi:hypothetical protein